MLNLFLAVFKDKIIDFLRNKIFTPEAGYLLPMLVLLVIVTVFNWGKVVSLVCDSDEELKDRVQQLELQLTLAKNEVKYYKDLINLYIARKITLNELLSKLEKDNKELDNDLNDIIDSLVIDKLEVDCIPMLSALSIQEQFIYNKEDLTDQERAITSLQEQIVEQQLTISKLNKSVEEQKAIKRVASTVTPKVENKEQAKKVITALHLAYDRVYQ